MLGLSQATLAFHSAGRGCSIEAVIMKAFALIAVYLKETGNDDAT